jgi:hypothetical protein
MKQNSPISDQRFLEDRTILVRPVTDEDRSLHCEGNFDQQFYKLTDLDGNLVAIVGGKPEFAFRIAENIQSEPYWVH